MSNHSDEVESLLALCLQHIDVLLESEVWVPPQPKPKEFRWLLHWQKSVANLNCRGSLSPRSGCSKMYDFAFVDCKLETIPCRPFLYCIHCITSRDLTYLTRNIQGQILIMGDFNGHSYLWDSRDVDTRGEVFERFTDKHNLCILNDGTHTYLKPQAQHVNKPTSTIDLTISTPGLALRSVWEVLPDTHGSDHYPILTSILPSVAEIQPSCDPSHWVFSKANWEQFHDDPACLSHLRYVSIPPWCVQVSGHIFICQVSRCLFEPDYSLGVVQAPVGRDSDRRVTDLVQFR